MTNSQALTFLLLVPLALAGSGALGVSHSQPGASSIGAMSFGAPSKYGDSSGNPPSSAGALSGASVRAAGSGPLSMPPPSSVGALSFDVPSKYGDSSGPVLSAKAAALFAYKNSAPSGGSSSGNHSVIIAVSSTVGGLVAVVSLVAVGIIMRRSRSASPTPGAKVEGPFRKRFLGAARLPGSAPSRSRLAEAYDKMRIASSSATNSPAVVGSGGDSGGGVQFVKAGERSSGYRKPAVSAPNVNAEEEEEEDLSSEGENETAMPRAGTGPTRSTVVQRKNGSGH